MERNKRIVAIGSCVIDEYYEMNQRPVLGDKVVIHPIKKEVGGMISNAASVFAGYGDETYIIDRSGIDENSDLIRKSLETSGLNIDYLVHDSQYGVGKCFVMLYEGERIIYVIENPNDNLKLSNDEMKLLQQSEIIYSSISSLKRFNNPLKIIQEVGASLALDIEANTIQDFENDYELIRLAKYLFINESGVELFKDALGDNYLEQLLLNEKIVVLTLGKHGCKVYHKNESYEINGLEVGVVDTTGAGDTFNASFIHHYIHHGSLEQAGIFANAAAARSVQYFGPRSGIAEERTVMEFIEKKEISK